MRGDLKCSIITPSDHLVCGHHESDESSSLVIKQGTTVLTMSSGEVEDFEDEMML